MSHTNIIAKTPTSTMWKQKPPRDYMYIYIHNYTVFLEIFIQKLINILKNFTHAQTTCTFNMPNVRYFNTRNMRESRMC